jgi:hypothetical protein
MDKKRKPTKEHDFAVNAFRVVQEATGQAEPKQSEPETKPDNGKNPNAVALGRLGGLKGGKARLTKMTPEQRQDIARKAANKRWSKENG